MKCSNCGAELRLESVYCQNCGKPAQIVPDYNVFEDEDLLADLWDKQKKHTGEAHDSSKTEKNHTASDAPKSRNHRTKKAGIPKRTRLVAAVLVVCLVAAGSLVLYLTSYDHYLKKGQAYMDQQDYAGAIPYLEKAIAKGKEDITACYLAAEAYEALGDDEQAEDSFKQVIAIQEDYLPAYQGLIRLYQKAGDYDALQELQSTVTNRRVLKLFDDMLVDSPAFSQKAGKYQDDVTLELTADTDCTIYYTLDGTDPVPGESGMLYREPITLTEGITTVKAISQNSDGTQSPVASAKYVITYEKPDFPDVSPSEGTFSSPTTIYVTIPEGATVYYTWDGSQPTRSSAVCTGTLEVPEGNNILSLIVIDRHGLSSDVMQCNYRYIPD
jgi:hypothetical protein